MSETIDRRLKTCSECGQLFYPTANYMYKYSKKYQCSYTCFRKAESEDVKSKKRNYRTT